jgi:hypothetical protein
MVCIARAAPAGSADADASLASVRASVGFGVRDDALRWGGPPGQNDSRGTSRADGLGGGRLPRVDRR